MIPLARCKSNPAALSPLWRGAAVGLLVLHSIASTTLAASTGAVTLSGTVAVSCNITVTPQGPYNALDLTTSETTLNVATVTEQCSDPKGYTLTLTSANGRTDGLLVGAAPSNPGTVSYTIFYGGASVHLSNSDATVTSTNKKTTTGGAVNNLAISYAGASSLGADIYSDTLTFTITGK